MIQCARNHQHKITKHYSSIIINIWSWSFSTQNHSFMQLCSSSVQHPSLHFFWLIHLFLNILFNFLFCLVFQFFFSYIFFRFIQIWRTTGCNLASTEFDFLIISVGFLPFSSFTILEAKYSPSRPYIWYLSSTFEWHQKNKNYIENFSHITYSPFMFSTRKIMKN